ncbi:RraA family protein [Arthrobacter sp. D1-17]
MPELAKKSVPETAAAEGQTRPESLNRHSQDLVRALLSIADLSSTVADVLADLGVPGVVAAPGLHPLTSGTRLCGPAVTLKYERVDVDTRGPMEHGGSSMGYGELCASSSPNDIAVIDCGGDTTAAVLGGMTAGRLNLAGLGGCVVNGAIRDTSSIKDMSLPLWSLANTPQSGLRRFRVAALNAPVNVGNALVRAGDYIVADEDGICVIPNALFSEVARVCLQAEAAEKEINLLLSRCASVQEFDEALAEHKLKSSTSTQ